MLSSLQWVIYNKIELYSAGRVSFASTQTSGKLHYFTKAKIACMTCAEMTLFRSFAVMNKVFFMSSEQTTH